MSTSTAAMAGERVILDAPLDRTIKNSVASERAAEMSNAATFAVSGPPIGAKNIDEDTAAQMRRLFFHMLSAGKTPALDGARRIRVDDREMREDVQAEVAALWPQVTTENLSTISGYATFERGFRNLFGFEVEGVDYTLPVETDLNW